MNSDVRIVVKTGDVIRILIICLGFYLVYFFRNLLLLVLTAVVISSAVEPVVARFERLKLPRPFATVVIYLGVFTLVLAAVILIVPPFVSETANLANALPGYLANLEAWINSRFAEAGFSASFNSEVPSPEALASSSNELRGLANVFFTGATGTLRFVFGSLFNFMLVFVLAFYFTLQKYGIDNFLKVVVPPARINYALNLWHRAQKKIAQWMQGQLILAGIIGFLTYFGLLILGIEYAFLLAIFAMFGSLIPMIGPVVSVIPAFAVSLADGGVSLGLKVLLLYLVIQQVESNFIYPMVVKNLVGVPALVVILGVIVGGSLFGFLGIILSVPVAAAVMEYVKDIQKRNHEYEKKVEEATKAIEEEKRKEEDSVTA